MSKEKAMLRGQNAAAFVQYLKTSGFPYTLKISNYTTEIVSELYNIQFLQSMRGKECFAAYMKVKSNVSKLQVPVIDKQGLKYFNHNFKKDFYADAVINIDLKSAYATVLHNSKMITHETFKYLSKIPKMDRLASVGMLAGKKYVFSYNEKNELVEYNKITSKYEGFFYYCVKETERIMNDLQIIAAQDYLFTWVDGIYIKADAACLIEIEEYLKTVNFRYTIEPLKNFKVEVRRNKVAIQFDKFSAKKAEFTTKYFNVPARPSMLAEDLVFILTGKNVKNETIPTKIIKREA